MKIFRTMLCIAVFVTIAMPALGKGSHRFLNVQFTQTKVMQMTYKLDLYRNNRYSKRVNSNIRKNRKRLRQCFVDSMPESIGVQKVRLDFVLSRKSGSIAKLRSSGGSKGLRDCLSSHLVGVDFSTRKRMLGKITLVYRTAMAH